MKKWETLQLGAVLILGLSLRLLAACQKDFWFDEAVSFAFARQSLPDLLTAAAADNHPPFYYLFLHFWMKLNRSEFFLRLPSIVFGTTSVCLVYLLGKKLAGKKAGLLSSTLFALSPLHVYFSAEARMYSLLTFLILIGFYSFLKILKKPTFLSGLLFTACCLASLYTHYFSIIFFLGLDLFLFTVKARLKKQLFLLIFCQALAGVIFLGLFASFLASPHPKPWAFSPLVGIPATFASFVIGGLGQVTQRAYLLAPANPLTVKFLFVSAIAFLSLIFLKGLLVKFNLENRRLLLVVLFFPLALASLAHYFHPLYSPRTFTAFSFPFYLFLALGLESFPKSLALKLKTTATALLFSVVLVQNFYRPFKPTEIKQTTDFLRENAQKSDVLAHTSLFSYHSFLYYLPEFKSQYLILPSDLTRQTTDIIGGTPKPVTEIRETKGRIWLVVDPEGTRRQDLAEIQKELSHRSLSATRNIGGLTTFLYSPISSP